MVIATVIGFRSRLSVVRAAQRYAACDVLGLEAFDEEDLYVSPSKQRVNGYLAHYMINF
jgi:hypothetical protein